MMERRRRSWEEREVVEDGRSVEKKMGCRYERGEKKGVQEGRRLRKGETKLEASEGKKSGKKNTELNREESGEGMRKKEQQRQENARGGEKKGVEYGRNGEEK